MIPDHFRRTEPPPYPCCVRCAHAKYVDKWQWPGCSKHDFKFDYETTRNLANVVCDDYFNYGDDT